METRDKLLEITLKEALERTFKGVSSRHDLELEAEYAGGKWRPDGIAVAGTYNNRLHHPRFKWIAVSDDAIELEASADLEPDLWVPGGKFESHIRLSRSEVDFNGEYIGSFNGKQVKGTASAKFAERRCSCYSLFKGKPEILCEFEEKGSRSRLYDFSNAGSGNYASSPRREFNVMDFGAIPDSGKDCRDAVQGAVDAAAAAGGGIVIFPPGEFDFSVDEKKPPVFIESSNIVVRGAGTGIGGTVLVNHRYSETPVPSKLWLAGLSPAFFIVRPNARNLYLKDESEQLRKICKVRRAERGSQELIVSYPSELPASQEFIPGRAYILRYLENSSGALAKSLVLDLCRPAANYLGEGKALVTQIFKLENVNGDRIKIDSPVHRTLDDEWISEICEIGMIENIAIENMRMRSCWDRYFVHHKNAEHDNGWDHVKLRRARNSVVRNIVHESTSSAVSLHDCKSCLVEDNHICGNPGHNGFICGGASTDNLFRRCRAGAQMHALNLSGTACGNVFLDCEIDEPGGIDLHGGIGLDNLFDNIRGGVFAGGGSNSAVPPRHGPGLVMWNCMLGHFDPYKPWRTAEITAVACEMPGFISVGVRGRDGHRVQFKDPDGIFYGDRKNEMEWVEAADQQVRPLSLYAYQQLLSTGARPEELT